MSQERGCGARRHACPFAGQWSCSQPHEGSRPLGLVLPARGPPGSGLSPRETASCLWFLEFQKGGALKSRPGGAGSGKVTGFLLVTREGQELALESWALAWWGSGVTKAGRKTWGRSQRQRSPCGLLQLQRKRGKKPSVVGHVQGRDGSRLGVPILSVMLRIRKSQS